MEPNNELRHWGIKGQKWGIRRYQNPDGSYTEEGIRRYQKKYPYQNPDGSLTEAGKTNYMKAARKNQLDYKNLSNNDLDMINNRFNKENQYKRNIENYEKSTFKYKAKEALISRIKGNNGGGDGGGKKKGKGGGGKGNGILTKLLLSPIEQAFKDALKSDNSGGKEEKEEKEENNKKGKNDTNEEYAPGLRNLLSSGRHFALTGYSEDSSERLESRRKNGQRFVEEAVNRTSEEILRERSRNNAIARKNDSWWQNRMDNPDSWGWSGMTFDTSNYLEHSGWVVTRSDELYHFGIKGQKWGIRRYENPDGTLTEEGKRRYGYIKLDLHSELNRARENQKIAAKKLMDANFLTKARAAKAAAAADEKFKEVENVYNDLLKHQKEVDEYNKREFDSAKKEIHENGFESWWNKNRSTDNEDAFCDHIWNTQGKLLDAWWNKRYELNYDDGSWKRVQQKYVKQLAKNLGLPQTKEVNEYLSDWFVNGDD